MCHPAWSRITTAWALGSAEDALLLDTTELSIEAAVEQAAKAVEDRMLQGRA